MEGEVARLQRKVVMVEQRAQQHTSGQGRETAEQLIAKFDVYGFSQEQVGELKVSPDNKHIAYVNLVEAGYQVVVDQVAGQVYKT